MLLSVIIFIDQIIKFLVVKLNPQICIVPNVFGINYTKNTGGIYGIMQGSNIFFIILAFSILIMLIICYKSVKSFNYKKILCQVILAGGISNLVDRIFRGFVVDFISLKFFGVFNTSDACIVISVVILIFMELKENFSGSKCNSSNTK